MNLPDGPLSEMLHQLLIGPQIWNTFNGESTQNNLISYAHDATATHYLLFQYIQIGFTILVLPF